jgi:hypothetical protein
VLRSLNYEPVISGGYRRLNGFERFSGKTSPTSAAYWIVSINLTGLRSRRRRTDHGRNESGSD